MRTPHTTHTYRHVKLGFEGKALDAISLVNVIAIFEEK